MAEAAVYVDTMKLHGRIIRKNGQLKKIMLEVQGSKTKQDGRAGERVDRIVNGTSLIPRHISGSGAGDGSRDCSQQYIGRD